MDLKQYLKIILFIVMLFKSKLSLIYTLILKNKTADYTNDIIDEDSISAVLHVKFSPDTIIDGNTFNLNHINDAKICDYTRSLPSRPHYE